MQLTTADPTFCLCLGAATTRLTPVFSSYTQCIKCCISLVTNLTEPDETACSLEESHTTLQDPATLYIILLSAFRGFKSYPKNPDLMPGDLAGGAGLRAARAEPEEEAGLWGAWCACRMHVGFYAGFKGLCGGVLRVKGLLNMTSRSVLTCEVCGHHCFFCLC